MNIYHKDFIDSYTNFIFDFDGVIKDSIAAKGEAFAEIFSDSPAIKEKIINHHKENGGISRSYKIPIYLKMCGKEPSEENILIYSRKFSITSKKKVINSDWIAGFRDYAKYLNLKGKYLHILSATPQNELREITTQCQLDRLFEIKNIIGAPTEKYKYLSLAQQTSSTVFFGDALSDYEAAKRSKVDFVQCKSNDTVMDEDNRVFKFSIKNFEPC